jgi:Glucose / Sorbosone dehydrogenase
MRVGLLTLALLLALAAPAAAAPQLVDLGSFDRPLYVTSPPGDQRIFVVEKGGVIKLVGGGTFLDISSEVNGDDEERGLLSMAFSPNYASNGLFYVDYTDKDGGDINVVEYKRSASNPNVADPASRRPVLFVEHSQAQYHNGGQLQFGPDGALYMSIGDALTSSNAQDLTDNPYGKVLRLNLAGGYSVWSYGLRNPWRFSFDRSTGDMIIGDVGESTWEEIDWSAAPTRGQNVNWGWPDAEGPDGMGGQRPVAWHAHNPPDTFCAIVGGYVVRDPGLPTLNGHYIYGDNCNTAIWMMTPRTGANDRKTGLTVSHLSSFGEDSCGHVYAASLEGHVYRIQDGAVSPCTVNGHPADTTPPKLSVALSGVKKALRKHELRVAMRCSEGCSVTVGTRLKNVRKLKARHRDLAANQRAVITLKLSKATLKKLRKRLEHQSSVRVSVAVRATDAAGNTKTVHRGGRIRRHH